METLSTKRVARVAYDYKRHCYIVGGLYIQCGFADLTAKCSCYGCRHAGQKAKV